MRSFDFTGTRSLYANTKPGRVVCDALAAERGDAEARTIPAAMITDHLRRWIKAVRSRRKPEDVRATLHIYGGAVANSYRYPAKADRVRVTWDLVSDQFHVEVERGPAPNVAGGQFGDYSTGYLARAEQPQGRRILST